MPTTVNNVETFSHVPHIVPTAPSGSAGSVPRRARARRSSACRATWCARDSTSFRWARRSTRSSSSTPAACPTAQGEGRDPRRHVDADPAAGQLDVPMANEFLRERKTMLGTGGIMVMDETTCMVRVACVITYFFRDESCGQCTQCREGTGWLNKIVESHRARRRRGRRISTSCSTSRARWRVRRSAPSRTRRPGPCRGCCATSDPTSRRTSASRSAPSPRASSSDADASPSTEIVIEVPEGRTDPPGPRRRGPADERVDIPHYCWHPKLSIDGSCRLCQVEVEGHAEAPDRVQHAGRRTAW